MIFRFRELFPCFDGGQWLATEDTLVNQESYRHRSPYSLGEKLLRVAWSGTYATIFRWSPRPCWILRSWLLRVFGAKIGKSVHIHNTARIFYPWRFKIGDHSSIGDEALIYNLGQVDIGRFVTISQRSHLCAGTHDYTTRHMTLIRASIAVKDDAWVCADAFVGPNVTICEGAIVGARAVAVKDVDAWIIVAGNPARKIKTREFAATLEAGERR